MKTIKERAKSYARKVWCGWVRDFVNHKKATELDFIAGAQSEGFTRAWQGRVIENTTCWE